MAYTKVNPTTGDTITQTMLRAMELQHEEAIAMDPATADPSASCYNSASQGVLTGATDALTLDSETSDVTGWHSTSTNTERLTVPSGKAGVYLVHGHSFASQSAAAVTGAILHLKLNGTTVRKCRTTMADGGGNDAIPLHVWAVLVLAAGDYVSLAGEAVSSGATFGAADAALATRLEVARLAKA